MTLADVLVRLRQEMTCCRLTMTNSAATPEQVERDGWTSVHADDVLALVAIAEAARVYVEACEALDSPLAQYGSPDAWNTRLAAYAALVAAVEATDATKP